MKKRNRTGRSRKQSARLRGLSSSASRGQRKRRTWTFEQLEERHFLSATTLTGADDVQWYTVSGSTAEGQQLIDLLNAAWRTRSSSTGDSSVDYGVRSLPNDPYFNYQWNLLNVGQLTSYDPNHAVYGVAGEDIGVVGAWDQGATGEGVLVAVLDTGVAINHPDLAANISAYSYNAYSGGSYATPSDLAADGYHGTAVAGIIAAVGNNNEGITGIAYDAQIMPIYLGDSFWGWADNLGIAQALLGAGAPVDIFNNSWGPSDAVRYVDTDTYYYDPFDPTDVDFVPLLQTVATTGRDGLGAIYVWASGNGAGPMFSSGFDNIGVWDSASSDFWVNSPYTIGVGMVDHDGSIFNSDGTVTLYGEMSSSVLVVAPSGSGPFDIVSVPGTGSGIWSTDLQGDDGDNISPYLGGIEIDGDSFPDTDYTSTFNGTSASAPHVSGVIALMLDANPNLTYRDVEEILVRSSRQNDPLDGSWAVNAIEQFQEPMPTMYLESEYFLSGIDEIPWIVVEVPNEDPEADPEYEVQVGETIPAYTEPAVAADTTFRILGPEEGDLAGMALNGVTVSFVLDPSLATDVHVDSSSIFPFLGGDLIISVQSEDVAWFDIAEAVEAAGFQMLVSSYFGTFSAEDTKIVLLMGNGLGFDGSESSVYYNPILNPRTDDADPPLYTNGAGYTVSYGRYGSFATEYGYAHGVVDAELAVELAKKWDTYDQYLAPELTYLAYLSPPGSFRIPGAEVSSEETGIVRVPGGLGGESGFIAWYEEFFKEPELLDPEEEGGVPTIDPESLPFAEEDPPDPTRGGGLTIAGPSGTNAMSVEWVEVQVDISGGGNDQDFLRLTLVSPDGTESELTNYQLTFDDPRESFQELPDTVGEGQLWVDPPGELDDNSDGDGVFNWVYTTNRSWGERSEGTWTLYAENYSGTTMGLDGVRILFHGTAVSAAGEDVYRVSGKVGLDAGYDGFGAQDGFFGEAVNPISGLTESFSRYGPALEPYAAGVTVVATDTATGQVVDRFVVGADGNYYFDLPEGQYEFVVLDPDARVFEGVSETANPGDGPSDLASYGSSWTVNVAPVDSFYTNGVRAGFIEGVNFLLDPGEVPNNEAIFEGAVFADLDGDGVKDPQDAGVAGFIVYADLNHTGQWEASEPYVVSDALGKYSLTVATTIGNTYTIGVEPLDNWDVTYPGGSNAGFHTVYADVGETTTGLDFGVTPPATLPNQTTGMVFGFVYGDENGDGAKQATEAGVPGVSVVLTESHSYDSADVPQAVQDATVISEIQVGDIGEIADLNVTLDITHAIDSELEVYLISPLGTRVELFSGVGGSFSNFTNTTLDDQAETSIEDGVAPFLGSYKPMGVLANLEGESAIGTWQLEVTDIGADEGGTLNSWSLTIRTTVMTVKTNDDGAFQFTGVEPGEWQIEPVVALPSSVTQPSTGYRTVTITEGKVVTGLVFGVANMAIYDYGDLIGDDYHTTLAQNGARHRMIEGFSLGSLIDSELDTATITYFDPQGNPDPPDPALNGIGDDADNDADEDGVSIVGGALTPGLNTFEVELQGVGGYLDAWIDINDDGDFDDVVGGVSEHVIVSVHRNTGTHQLQIVLPSSLTGGDDDQVASRFRWSRTYGLDYFGAADIGEVEDYLFTVDIPILGDFDRSGYVDEGDYDIWKSTYGSTTDLRADGNYDGVVNSADYSIWRDHLGEGEAAAAGALALDTSAGGGSTRSLADAPIIKDVLGLTNGFGNSTPSAQFLAWMEQVGVTYSVVNGEYHYFFEPGGTGTTASSPLVNSLSEGGLQLEMDAAQLGFAGLQLATQVDALSVTTVNVSPATAVDSATSGELQLLDRAMSDMALAVGDQADEGAELLIGSSDDQDVDATDLALAAAFEEETPWWVGV